MSETRLYELVYIVSPDATEQAIADLHTQVESIVARLHGEMVRTETWGRRRLAEGPRAPRSNRSRFSLTGQPEPELV